MHAPLIPDATLGQINCLHFIRLTRSHACGIPLIECFQSAYLRLYHVSSSQDIRIICCNRTSHMAPEPINFAPSQYWDGNDGSWSSFAIRVGTPSQIFRVLPSTAGQETWIPRPETCVKKDLQNCASSRGALGGLFATNKSSSWKDIGIYHLGLEAELGYRGNGLFGSETVGLQVPNSGGVELHDQIVAGIVTDDYYFGIFGLGAKPINFTNLNNPVPSFLHTLKSQEKIPSLSWGYTAGASYRKYSHAYSTPSSEIHAGSPKVHGSLTLGGYDKSRFQPNEHEYLFGNDDSKPLSISIEAITASNSLQGPAMLLGGTDTVYVSIDSTIPHLWLPREICDRFEKAFGLSYDPTTDLYLAGNLSVQNQLRRIDASITIGLGVDKGPLNRTNIVLPYSAFDLEALYPIYKNATRYFPIRRAANGTQYRLGRVFLQEAYIVADYERSRFSIHQAVFENPMPSQSIVAISPMEMTSRDRNGTTTNTPEPPIRNSGGALTKGAIAGITVGACVLLTMILYLFYRQWRTRGTQQIEELGEQGQYFQQAPLELHSTAKDPPELGGAVIIEMHQLPQELGDTSDRENA